MFDRVTERWRAAMGFARSEAVRLQHDTIGPEHMFLGIVEIRGAAATVLERLCADLPTLKREVAARMTPGTAKDVWRQIPFTEAARSVLEHCLAEAVALDHNYLGTEHILLGLLAEPEGVVAQVLQARGVNIDSARAAIRILLGE